VYGRELCNRISEIGFDPLVGVVHDENSSAGVTMHQSALIIGAAISNYCIDKFGLLPKTLTY
jgi:Na+-translocating ferredoxin:NAD+ oxidoreductase RnfA subunit